MVTKENTFPKTNLWLGMNFSMLKVMGRELHDSLLQAFVDK